MEKLHNEELKRELLQEALFSETAEERVVFLNDLGRYIKPLEQFYDRYEEFDYFHSDDFILITLKAVLERLELQDQMTVKSLERILKKHEILDYFGFPFESYFNNKWFALGSQAYSFEDIEDAQSIKISKFFVLRDGLKGIYNILEEEGFVVPFLENVLKGEGCV